MELTSKLIASKEAVVLAAKIAQNIQLNFSKESIVSKLDCSPVTMADYAVQATISLVLKNKFPSEPFLMVAEEDTNLLEKPEYLPMLSHITEYLNQYEIEFNQRVTNSIVLDAIKSCNYSGGPTGGFWVLDPIDGTKGFIRGEQYAIGLSYIYNSIPLIGTVACPNLPLEGLNKKSKSDYGTLFYALKDYNCYMCPLNDIDNSIQLKLQKKSPQIYLESYAPEHTKHDIILKIAEKCNLHDSIRIDSMTKYCLLARGDSCLYLRLAQNDDYIENIWDHAPGYFILKEAGGCITDMRGRELNFGTGKKLTDNYGVVATGNFDHEMVTNISKSLVGNM